MDYQSLALSPLERAILFVDGVWKFTPRQPEPTKRARKPNAAYGVVRQVAIDFANGGFDKMTLPQVAEEHRLSYESLKAAHWRVVQQRQNAQKISA